MIIDFHCHLRWENLPSKEWIDAQVKGAVETSGRSPEQVRERLKESWDPTGDLLAKDMAEAGIDVSVLAIIDCGLAAGCGPAQSLEEVHQVYAAAARRHPGKLIAFAGIDPRRGGAVEFLERAVKEWGMRGLKLHPGFEFYPNDHKCYLLYAKCQELKIPVLVHTGPDSLPYYGKYGMPIYLAEVASDFPNLNIVLAHAGGCFWQEAAYIAQNKTNIYVDLAMWQPTVLRNPIENFYRPLRAIIDSAGRNKVLFGSDWPGLRLIRKLNHAAWVKAIKEPPPEVKAAGIEFTKEEVDAIMGDNAARLLGLKK